MVMGQDLLDTLRQQAAYAEYYKSQPPVACPNDGTPLQGGPPRAPGVLFCPNGDFYYPRDWDPDVHSGM
jgi:hypothetical protein